MQKTTNACNYDLDQLKDRYGCDTVEEMVQTPLFIAEFTEWAESMDRAAANNELEF